MGLVCTYMGCSQNYGPLVLIDYVGGLQGSHFENFPHWITPPCALKT